MTTVGARPAGLTTLEQDIIRQIMAFKDANPQTTFREEGEVVSKACLWNLKINDSGAYYFVGRVLVPVTTLVDTAPIKKLFMRAIEYPGGLTNYPTGYETT